MNQRITNTLLAAAVGGILVGATGCGSSQPAPASGANASSATALPKHACKGQNDCKHQGGCKTDKNACKGQNECKGQGGCKTA